MLAACGGGETVVAVDAVEPNQGPLGGGQTITVRGEGFLAGGAAPNYALLGGALTLQVSALSDSELQLVTPPGSEPGEVDLVIFNSNGYAVAAGAYAYVGPPEITALDPPSGHYKGGTEVTITGSGFQELDAGQAAVTFDGVPARNIRVVSDSEILVTTPPGTPYRHVTVALANARGQAALDRGYEYTQASGLLALTGRRGYSDPRRGLYYVDTETGEAIFLFEVDVRELEVQGLATAEDGTVYGVSSENNLLYQIDLQRQSFEEIGPLAALGGPGVVYSITDLEFHDGILYGLDRNQGLFGALSTESGLFSPLGEPNSLFGCCDSRSLMSDGTSLYFLRSGNLYVVDPETGALSEPFGAVRTGLFSGAAFVDGAFYLSERIGGIVLGGGGPEHARIWRVSLDGLAAGLVATVPSGIHGLAVAP